MKTRKIVISAMLASLVCVATMVIKIPSPFKGYLNLGDCIVLLSGWLLSSGYGFFAAGIGSALADVFSGYALYAPATFVIKGFMALVCGYGFKILRKKFSSVISRTVSGAFAEIFMVLGYFVFEGVLYGFGASAVNIPANSVQGVAGLLIGAVLVHIFEKNHIL